MAGKYITNSEKFIGCTSRQTYSDPVSQPWCNSGAQKLARVVTRFDSTQLHPATVLILGMRLGLNNVAGVRLTIAIQS